MKYLAAIGALCFLATSSLALAQLQVSAQTDRSGFLLYERVDLIVTISNIGDTDLVLDNNEGHPWLSFLVNKHNRLPVHPERSSTFKAISLRAGESKTLRINLTPLFLLREEGDYSAAAVVDLPGADPVISNNVPFSLLRGRSVWSQARPVDSSQRVYSLLRFSPQPDRTDLYLRVEDPGENIVYANLALGEVVAYVDPEVFFDPTGNLHVMQPIAMGSYLYTRASADGKILDQRIFKTFRSVPPRLTKLEDGNVIVVGGLEQDASNERETLSEGQKRGNAPIAPPPSLPPAPSIPVAPATSSASVHDSLP
jgi:hypothetical protein